VKLKDRDAHRRPCTIGEGTLGCPETVAALMAADFRGWVVVEWDRLWIPSLDTAEEVLPRAVRRLYEWTGLDRLNPRSAAMA
jgi:sugar phosphate isomerase/epimerase